MIDVQIGSESWERVAPAFAELSPQLYVPFTVHRLRHARVVWLNEPWFAAAGREVGTPAQRRHVERWLLDRYAVGVPGEDDPAALFIGPPLTYWADRYGAPSGSMHGGSGRVGTLGAFNVKGVGRTPLVGDQSDWYHSHGCMWLEEAMREAILASVAARLFPHGAVPVIAVIDAGCRYNWRNGKQGARRALIVRPAFLRVASFMRSIFFGTCGMPGSAQWSDALRVRDLWTAEWPTPGVADLLTNAFAVIGYQYGWGRVHRLWPGPPFASNLTLTGALVDFGSFRAMPDWSRAQGEAASHGFGAEEALITAAARTLERIGRANGVELAAASLVTRFAEGVQDGESAALAAEGIAPGSDAAVDLARIRTRQQACVTGLAGPTSSGMSVLSLTPRPGLYRERLLADTLALVSDLGDGEQPNLDLIARFIDQRSAAEET